jgi:hypothetical protein
MEVRGNPNLDFTRTSIIFHVTVFVILHPCTIEPKGIKEGERK